MSDKIKTLSQAIRLGATFRPQCTRALFVFKENSREILKTCAFGAALEAIGSEDEPATLTDLQIRFPAFDKVCREVIDMNDHQGKTREQIADWLEAQGL